LGENFDLDDFVYAIKANQTVKHVCFSGTFVRELQPDQWKTMLEAVGHLSTLEELQIWCSTIPIGVFRKTIESAKVLRKVYFFRITLSGTQAEFDDFAATLKDHQGLRDFRIGGFQTSEETIILDSVVEAFAEMPALEVVSLQLTGFHESVPFSGNSLARLFQSESLSDLYLSRLGLVAEHFDVIVRGMTKNENLRVLDLFGNNISNEHVVSMAEALAQNTGLETLVLPCPAQDLSVESCKAISQALQLNKTLVTLNLPRSILTDEGLTHIAEGLTMNTTLKKIEVGVSKSIGEKGTDALEEMLEKNYELQRLVVSSAEKGVKEKVEFYMRLNEVGRGSLLRDGKATREQWVEMLSTVTNDLDCLFYFISMNPALCQFANTQGADVIITEEFRPKRRHTIELGGYNSVEDEANKLKAKPRRASAF
jgi:hypothetical protein